MKKIQYRLVLLLALITAVYACDDEHEYNLTEKPVVSNTGATSFDLTENETATIDLAVSEAISSSIFVIFRPVSGTADYSDYIIGDGETIADYYTGGEDGYVVEIPAYSTSYSVDLSAILDDELEDSESVELELASYYTRMGTIEGETITYNITIENQKSNIVEVTFDWDQEFTYDSETYTLCDIAYDIDFAVADADFNLTSYFAASADCPEVGELDVDEYEDGDYHFFYNVWDDGTLSTLGLDAFDIPITVSWTRGGADFDGSYTQTTTDVISSDSFDSSAWGYVISFTISGEDVTFYDYYTDETIATGRTSQLANYFQVRGQENLPARNK